MKNIFDIFRYFGEMDDARIYRCQRCKVRLEYVGKNKRCPFCKGKVK